MEDPMGDNELVPITNADQALAVISQSILGLWEVVNNLTRLRPRRLEHFHVTIFGSARLQADTPEYEGVKKIARELAAMGCRIVTGGGPGLMQAANEGALAVASDDPEASIGIRVHLPFEQGVNAFVGRVYQHRTFFTRLHHFILISDAFIVVPGGI